MNTKPRGPANHDVERADASDVGVLAQVIAHAFRELAVSRWLVPDPRVRRVIFPGYFTIHIEHALAHGVVLTTSTRDAAALWLPGAAGEPSERTAGYNVRLAALTGPHLARFKALDEAFDQHHPTGTVHEYLAILAVRPGHQRRGIGTALLHAWHDLLDQGEIPAYLEASDAGTREIYLRNGYTDHGAPIQLPDGPTMYPMWRQSRGGVQPDATGTRF